MGRSRADNDPAVSRARFRRRPRPEPQRPEPIPGLPTVFPAANPAPEVSVVPPRDTARMPADPARPPNHTAPLPNPAHLTDPMPNPAAAPRYPDPAGDEPDLHGAGFAAAQVNSPPPADAPRGRAASSPRVARPYGTPGRTPTGASAPTGYPVDQSIAGSPSASAAFNDPSATGPEPSRRRKAKKSRSAPPPPAEPKRRERATQVVREMLAPSGVEPEELARRVPDTLREVGEHALFAVRKWADPRERELRKRRRTRRRSLRLGTAGGLTTAGTVGLVLISAPAWAVIVVGGGAVALVTGTAVTAKRYLQLRKEPLPQASFAPRKLPPLRSAARASIARLVRAERALHGLGDQISRSGRLPEDDLNDTLETAASGAAALHALAADMVAMERAAGALGGRDSILVGHVQAVATRLDGGVVEFEGMVAAAARVLAVPESAAIADDLGWAMVHLRDAADRLDGWAQALTDLADERYRA
ncbi:hypothetical protein LTV02_02815 [Nocardia yamanashiensis]|uniref:phage shock envelope stress response protein PspM n=1 Tax=Nocardia yamanashiensis TaxID=209247 RepID=UPI001E43FCDA|nr:hypothetical protein [Nocardia yamanashiensis]UGT42371.1 hypothetical protein LTV02_02815 [Nocardia yamanashiensis]